MNKSMLEGIPFERLTAPTLLGIAVLLIFLGRLVPRSFYKDKVAEAEKWRLAYETEREARATSDAQTAELLELAQTSHQLLVAMFGASEHRRAGGADVVQATQ